MDKYKPVPLPPEIPLLDADFDEVDEQILETPPLYSPRRNGRLIRMNIDPDEDCGD